MCALATEQSVLVQLREAELSRDAAVRFGHELAAICQASGQALCVNDRLDLALELGTPRFHRKPSSPAASEMRSTLTRRFDCCWLTQGWHPKDELLPVGVDAVLVSPVFAARKGRAALGVSGLAESVVRAGATAVFALGGVDARAVDAVEATGAAGVAVQGAWYDEPDGLLTALGILR